MGFVKVRDLNIDRKLILIMGGGIALALAVLGMIAVNNAADITRERIFADANRVVEVNAQEIKQFFSERARVVKTFLADPAVVNFFADYTTFRAPVLGDPAYNEVIDYFDKIVADDPTVRAVFFADDDTQEYFQNRMPETNNGRIEIEGYLVKNRPWWHEAVEEDRLYLASPTVDAATGDVAVVIQTTVYLQDGTFLGVGGMDVLLDTVGATVQKIRYKGQGAAFLMDDSGEIIYFTGADLAIETHLENLDTQFADTRGFAQLSDRLLAGDNSPGTVEWKGGELEVLSAPIRSETPYINWTLGVLVPEEVFDAPVRRSRLVTALVVLLTIGLFGGLTLVVTRAMITRPIRKLLDRFQDIA